MLSWILLIIGMLLLGLFWMSIAPDDRKPEVKKVLIAYFIVGIVVFFLESTFIPLG